ncbi:hypothetical protein PTI98_013422 [Pleurotus ostreatus]|nr:hypothetical protein PTI98_013422 [Pleurotus ostreatus]
MAPLRDLSLADFIQKYTDMCNDEWYEDQDRDLVNFALSGIDLQDEEAHIRLNLILNHRLRPNAAIPTLTRDYDSFIGFTHRIPIRRDLYVYCLPPPHISTIYAKMHVQVQFHTPQGLRSLDPSKVPNILLAKFNDRHQLRLFFPQLMSDERESPVKLSMAESDELYDTIVRPTITTIAPHLAKDWPTTARAERFRANNTGRGYQTSAYIISSNLLPSFKRELHRRLQEHPRFRYCLFCTHIQGIKGSTVHDMSHYEADSAMARMFEDFDTRQGQWWVDVGIELQDGNRAIVWRKDAAQSLIAYVLQLTLDQAGVIARSRRFEYDVNAHLLEVAGFRVSFRSPIGEMEATYMQAYTTDKSLTYHKFGSQHSQNITGTMAMEGFPPKYCTELSSAYEQARMKNVAARLEVRLPLQHATNFLVEFDMNTIRESVLSIHRDNFWNWRVVRMDAFARLLSAMNDQAPDQCVSAAMLSTYAATVWMINGVHSRPDNQTGGRACHDIALPNCARLDQYHCYLLPVWCLVHAPNLLPPESNTVRLAVGDRLPLEHYEWVFNKTLPELRRMFGATGITRRRDLPRTRFRMNKGMSRARTGPSTIDVPPNFFGLEAVEEMITQETGPDVDAATHVLEAAPRKTVEQKALELWQQFPSCVLQKIGNPKDWGLSSYCRLSQTERRVAGIEKMKTTNLAVVFTRVQVKAATKQQWQDAFNAIFPPKGHDLPPSAQGWPFMIYYQDWKALLASLNETNAMEVRKVIWKEFKKLTWIPNATNDRPWRSNRMGAPWAQYPEPGSDPDDPFARDGLSGPQILWTPWLEDALVWNTAVPVIPRNQAAVNPPRAPTSAPGTPGRPRVESDATPGNDAGRQPSPDFEDFGDRHGAPDGTPGRPRVEEEPRHESSHESGFVDGHPSRPSVGRGLRGASMRSDRGEGPSRLGPTIANAQRQRPQRQSLDKGKGKAQAQRGGRRPWPKDKPFTLEALAAFAESTDEEDVGAPASKPAATGPQAPTGRYVLSMDNIPDFDTDSEDDPFAEEAKKLAAEIANPAAKAHRLGPLPDFDTDSEDDPFAEEAKKLAAKKAVNSVKKNGRGKGKAHPVARKRAAKSKVLKRKASVEESDEDEGSTEDEEGAHGRDKPKRKRTRI